MKINFHNYDSNSDLCLETDKNLVLVYGKNGAGKTTLSRSTDLDLKFVFNEDFIFANIYNISDVGAAQTSKTKENFSGLWIGEDIVKIRQEITTFSELEKVVKDDFSNVSTSISKYFQDNGVPFNLSEKIIELKKDDFSIDITKYKEISKSYKSKYEYPTSIENEDAFKKNLKYLKQNSLYNMLIGMINEDPILSQIILKNNNNALESLNKKIDGLSANQELLLEIEKVYKDKGITNDISKKIEDWYKIHISRTECLFCGNKNIKEALNKWKIIFEDENVMEKTYVISKIKETINSCDKILKQEEFKIVDDEIIKAVNNIKLNFDNQLTNIIANKYLPLSIAYKIEKRNILEANSIILNITNYILNNNKNSLEFLYNIAKYLSDEKKKKIDFLDKLMEESGDAIAESINDKFLDFGLNKNIKITVDKHSIPHKFTYSIKEHGNINELSDGQKHKVALAIFMDYLEKQDLKDKTIVIDDPVVSLDIAGYILFKRYLISKLINEHFDLTTNLIILTHDITYLYIQVSNIFENKKLEKITSIYKINSNTIKEIPLNYIKIDDITLFRNLLDTISNIKELRILNGIFIKTFRIMIDLKLRFFGLSFADNINIDKLSINATDKKKLQDYSNYFCELGRKPAVSDKAIFKGLENMQDSAKILGFGDFIINEHINKVKKIIDENIEGEEIGDLFEIINSVQLFLKDNTNREMIDYINHTRNSYSRNLIGLGLEDYYIKE